MKTKNGLSKLQKRQVFGLMIPTFIELFIVQLFAIADTMMLGNMPNSASAVAAVGITNSPINLFFNTIISFCIGITSSVSQFYGKNDKNKMLATIRQSLIVLGAIGVVVSVACYFFSDTFMRLLGVNDEMFENATTYFKIIAIGFFFHAVTSAITASFRGVGISNIPMYYNVFSGVFNVVLNYVLIYGKFGFPTLGIAGAAWATTISRGIGMIIAIVCIFKIKGPAKISLKESYLPKWAIIKNVFSIGTNCAIEQIILQFGAVVASKIIATMPTKDIASYQICTNLEGFSWLPGNACSAAATTLSGRCIGERKPETAQKYTYYIWKISFIFAAVFMAFFIFLGKPFCRLYTSDTYVTEFSAFLLIIMAVELPGIMTHMTLSGAMRGAGETKRPLFCALFGLWIPRVLGSYILVYYFGFGIVAVRACCTIDQFVRGFMILFFFVRGKWKEKKPVS